MDKFSVDDLDNRLLELQTHEDVGRAHLVVEAAAAFEGGVAHDR